MEKEPIRAQKNYVRNQNPIQPGFMAVSQRRSILLSIRTTDSVDGVYDLWWRGSIICSATAKLGGWDCRTVW